MLRIIHFFIFKSKYRQN